MPIPSITLTFRKIQEPLPPYQDVYREVSRPGIDGQQFKLEGKRGDRSGIPVLQFFFDKASAVAAKSAWEAAQGREVFLVDLTDTVSYQVFLHQVVVDEPRTIVSTVANDHWILRARLTATRTA